jgi:putative ABC transport system ATP-binding protein
VTDEPTAELDPDSAADILGLLRDRARIAGCTVLIATHDAAVAASCDRIVSLEAGRLARTPRTH